MEKDFTLFKVSWFTQRISSGSTETVEQIHARHRALVNFLQTHRLTTRTVLAKDDIISDDTSLMRSDLTEKGFDVYRKAEQKWLKSIDRTKKYTDMRIFEKELDKIK